MTEGRKRGLDIDDMFEESELWDEIREIVSEGDEEDELD